MNNPVRLVGLFVVSVLCARGADQPTSPSTYPSHVVPDSELRVLPSTRPDRQYQLHIGLPAAFHEHPERKYPVVFVTDGYWDFSTVAAIYGNLFYAKNIPEMLVVGLGYAGDKPDYQNLRDDDLGPTARVGETHASGHAADFLEMIEKTAIPLLEKEYRADPQHRYLMGCSMGGLFTLYAALNKPDLFQGYVADSPAVGSLFANEKDFAASGRAIPGRVFISEAENEWPAYRKLITMFYHRVEKDGIVKGGLKFRRAENVRHAGSKPETYTQGLLYVTAPIAPESGVQNDYLADPAGRGFCINFWPKKADANFTPDEQKTLQAHNAWLARLVADKRVAEAGAAEPGAKRAYSNILLFARDRSESEALVKASPAVQAGLLKYEVIAIEE